MGQPALHLFFIRFDTGNDGSPFADIEVRLDYYSEAGMQMLDVWNVERTFSLERIVRYEKRVREVLKANGREDFSTAPNSRSS